MNRSAVLSQSLMLAPLLGATGTVISASATLAMFVLVVGGYAISLSPLRSRLNDSALWLAGLLLAATLTTCADILARRISLQWHPAFSLYAGLIALQCMVLEHNGFFRQTLAERFKHGAMFGGLMLGLGMLRELIGHGSLGRGFSTDWQGLVFFSDGLHLATLVPGALILLGLLLAAWQACARPASISKETHHP